MRKYIKEGFVPLFQIFRDGKEPFDNVASVAMLHPIEEVF